MNAGIGTHIDAPAHCIPDTKTIEQLTLDELVTNCIMIDISTKADENYLIIPSDVEQFEKEHGTIPADSFVIFYTGWEKHWHTKEKYINKHNFPAVDISTAKLLLERNIAGLGIDTLSADTGKNGFGVHQVILGAGKYLVENIANASILPATGSQIGVFPIKIEDGTEAPIRLVGFL